MNHPQFKQPIPEHAKKVFSGILFDVYQWKQKMYDGSTKTFEKLTRRSTGTVIAVTQEGKIVMTRQEQPGYLPMVGLPGGAIEHDEDPLAAVKRELLEETGYESSDWTLWQQLQPHEKINYLSYTFVTRDARRVGAAGGDEGEKIELQLLSFDEFVELMADPGFRDDEVALSVLQIRNKPDKFGAFKRLLIG